MEIDIASEKVPLLVKYYFKFAVCNQQVYVHACTVIFLQYSS